MWSPHPPWLWSLLSPPHVVPIVPTLSPSSPQGPHVVSTPPWLWSLLFPPHVVPVIPMSFPCHLEGPHIMPNPPDTHPTHPPPPAGGGALNQ